MNRAIFCRMSPEPDLVQPASGAVSGTILLWISSEVQSVCERAPSNRDQIPPLRESKHDRYQNACLRSVGDDGDTRFRSGAGEKK